MGGNKAPRTKGNTRPSNSGRSAELLAASGGSVTGFVGFQSLSSQTERSGDGQPPAGCEDDFVVDSEFRVVMKKMFKKDSVTKLKALLEFSDYCSTKDEKEVKAILPYWPRLYNKLSVDYDWRVREGAFKAHEVLALRLRRNIAPHLKQMMPSWLLSLFDPYAPAASAAKSSFRSVFPDSKQRDAIVFCKSEIFNFCEDILLHQTIQTLADKSASSDEIRNKYLKVVSGSLQVLAMVLEVISDESELSVSLSSLLSDNKFWKLGRDTNPVVRCSWFKLSSSICQHCPEISKTYSKKICSTVFNNLSESDPIVSPVLWENALWVVAKIEGCWKEVNFKKGFLPQFWSILREGGRGNAVTIFPNLFPLVSHIPADLLEDRVAFYETLFENLLLGLNKVITTPRDFNSIIRAYVECLTYAIVSNSVFDSDSQKEDFFKRVILDQQLIQLTKTALVDKNAVPSNSILFPEMGRLMKSLLKVPSCRLLLFSSLDALLASVLLELNQNEALVLSRLSKMLFSWVQPEKETKQKRRIGFAGEDAAAEVRRSSCIGLDLEDEHIRTIALFLFRESVSRVEESKYDLPWINLVLDLLSLDGSNKLVAECFEVKAGDASSLFWEKHLKTWIDSQKGCLPNDAKLKKVKSLVDIYFLLYSRSSDKSKFLLKVVEMNDPITYEFVFKRFMTEVDPHINQWISSPEFEGIVLKLTEEVLQRSRRQAIANDMQRETEAIWNILRVSFSLKACNKTCIEAILNKFKTNLELVKGDPTDQVIDFNCDIIENLFEMYKPCFTILSTSSLLLTLFSMSCEASAKQDKLKNAWSKGLLNYVSHEKECLKEGGLIALLSTKIRSLLEGKMTSFEHALLVIENATHLFDVVRELKDTVQPIEIEKLIENTLLPESIWLQMSNTFLNSAVLSEYWLRGTLLPPEMWPQTAGHVISTIAAPFIYSAFVTSSVLIKLTDMFSDELKPGVNLSAVIRSQLPHLFLTVGYTSASPNKFDSEQAVEQVTRDMLSHFKTLQRNKGTTKDMAETMVKMTYEQNILYGLGLKCCLQQVDHLVPLVLEIDVKKLSYSKLVLFQLCAEYVDRESLKNLLEDCFFAFLCLENYDSNENASLFLSAINSILRTSSSLTSYDHLIRPLLEAIVGLKKTSSDLFLYNTLYESEGRSVSFAMAVIDFLVIAVNNWGSSLNQDQVDFVLCSLTSWILNIFSKPTILFGRQQVVVFCCRVLDLLVAVTEAMRSESAFSKCLVEWKEFHSKKIVRAMIPVLASFAVNENLQDDCLSDSLIHYFGRALTLLPCIELEDIAYPPEVQSKQRLISESGGGNIELHAEQEQFLKHICCLTGHSKRPISYAAHSLLMKYLPIFARGLVLTEVDDDREDNLIGPPSGLLTVLEETDRVVDEMLIDFKVGDCCCLVAPTSDCFPITMGYLLNWLEINEFFSHLSEELRSSFGVFLTESGFLSRLFNNLFRLMPVADDISTDSKFSVSDMFKEDFNLDQEQKCLESEIQHLSCQVYLTVLRNMPASVRQWFSNQEKRVADVVNQFTARYVSDLICFQEISRIKAVHEADMSNFKSMTVKPRPNAREVLATYAIEEMSIELTIQLSPNHPLGPVSIDGGRRVGVSSSQWRTWLLQLTTFLTYQNGSILEGLLLWKKNIDKRFEGLEECMICFYILHGSTCQLPRLTCRNCKKRYHSACLYKWFSTSNNSTCPLCRNLFSFKS